jgi:hypothetical protein
MERLELLKRAQAKCGKFHQIQRFLLVEISSTMLNQLI